MLLSIDNIANLLVHFPLVSILSMQATMTRVWGEGSHGPSQITRKKQ